MPAAKRKPPRDRSLARIHILKKDAGLDDDTYRDVLWVHGQVRTAAKLDTHGRDKVIKHLEGLIKRMGKSVAPAKARPNNTDTRGREELQKIEALLTDAGLPWAYALSILKRQTNGRVERIEFADGAARAAVIAALDRAAKKRLAGELQAIFGNDWPWHAGGIARHLFGFPSSNKITAYAETMSRVLRWWRGEIQAVCAWPVNMDQPQCCTDCYARARRQERA